MMAARSAPQTQPPPEDHELLVRFTGGDLGAFETLFRQHQAEVYRWIVRVVRDTAAAEDLTLETFWRIYRAHARFDPGRSFGAWARRIAMNVSIDYLKAQRPEVALASEVAAVPVHLDAQEGLRRQTARAFRELPAKLRAVATLALVEERPYEEIAASLGLSVGAVASRVFRAVRRLRQELKRLGVKP